MRGAPRASKNVNKILFDTQALVMWIGGQPLPTKLGMKDSGSAHTETLIPHRARGCERSAGSVSNASFYDMPIPFSAGALYSTVKDLYKWDQALYTGRLLPASCPELLFRPNLESYGYGWALLVPKEGQAICQ